MTPSTTDPQTMADVAHTLKELMARLVRVETRLAALMEHEGMTVRNKGDQRGS